MCRARSQILFALFALIVSANRPAAAQQTPQFSQEFAFLFSYWPKDGNADKFNAGYREHLDWHRREGDSLTWYAWYVVAGNRVGLFIDGTFGIGLEAIDSRVKPREDAANFAATAAEFAEIDNRQVYRLRRDLSSDSPAVLEEGRPSRMIQVFRIFVLPGRHEAFESAVRKASDESGGMHTWYELLVGGRHNTYLVMIPRANWADFGEPGIDLLLSYAGDAVDRVDSEVWLFRADLTYRP